MGMWEGALPEHSLSSGTMEVTATNTLQPINANEFAWDFVANRRHKPVPTRTELDVLLQRCYFSVFPCHLSLS